MSTFGHLPMTLDAVNPQFVDDDTDDDDDDVMLSDDDDTGYVTYYVITICLFNKPDTG